MAETVNQPSAAPNRKVTFGSIGAAVACVVVFVLTKSLGLDLDDNVTAAISFLVAAAVGPIVAYLTPEWANSEIKASG